MLTAEGKHSFGSQAISASVFRFQRSACNYSLGIKNLQIVVVMRCLKNLPQESNETLPAWGRFDSGQRARADLRVGEVVIRRAAAGLREDAAAAEDVAGAHGDGQRDERQAAALMSTVQVSANKLFCHKITAVYYFFQYFVKHIERLLNDFSPLLCKLNIIRVFEVSCNVIESVQIFAFPFAHLIHF